MKLKKLLALILCATMLLPLGILPSFAAEGDEGTAPADGQPAADTASDPASAFADGENSLIVFVTGIGQSWSYRFDDSYLAEGAFASGTLQDYENYAPLIAEGKYNARWNLFVNDFADALKDKATIKTILKLVGQLLGTLFLRRNMVKEEPVRDLVRSLFSYNLVDETGRIDPHVITPRYTMPLSEYPGVTKEDGTFESEAKDRFYRSIPCRDIAREKLGERFEDYLYCFNYTPFSYPSQTVEALHAFIEQILAENKVGAEKVVLVPMSMGGSTVSTYLNAYPDAADNHVRRVVSIVGCWNGSDVCTDLLLQRYADNSADLFYNGIIGDMVGEPWGYVVNMALRLFSKKALRSFIDEALGVFVDELMLRTPAILALIPAYDYDTVRPLITRESMLKETDAYHEVQTSLQSRLSALEEQGITFSFIAGYGLPYGAVTSDYKAFGFMRSAAITNSDEIINVSSTVPGAEAVAWDGSFSDPDGRVLSPDGSVDIANAYYKDSSWLFRGQKHELEYNNTAIRLAIALALGKVKTVADCADPNGEYYFPQFNDARYIRELSEEYIPAVKAYVANGGALNDAQAALLARAEETVRSTVNDYAAETQLTADFEAMMVDLGLRPAPEKESRLKGAFNTILKKENDLTYKIYGAKGYLDFCR